MSAAGHQQVSGHVHGYELEPSQSTQHPVPEADGRPVDIAAVEALARLVWYGESTRRYWALLDVPGDRLGRLVEASTCEQLAEAIAQIRSAEQPPEPQPREPEQREPEQRGGLPPRPTNHTPRPPASQPTPLFSGRATARHGHGRRRRLRDALIDLVAAPAGQAGG